MRGRSSARGSFSGGPDPRRPEFPGDAGHYDCEVTPDELAAAIGRAAEDAVAAGEFAAELPVSAPVERPKDPTHGDFASSVALKLAKGAGKPPRAVAEAIAARLREVDGIEAVDVAGPGFLNFTLASAALGQVARTIVEAGDAFGRGSDLAGRTINLEFVSANPTGPVHLGHTRWAALGDSLHRILEAAGADVSA